MVTKTAEENLEHGIQQIERLIAGLVAIPGSYYGSIRLEIERAYVVKGCMAEALLQCQSSRSFELAPTRVLKGVA